MEIKLPPEMSKTYKIIGEIGAGGGGVIYLAEHLRLNKKVVLKADKRQMSVKLETLRREVDALKDLNHPNIPQVYDFIIENDSVFTVIDFIDGESLEKPLKRGERFDQAKVITWSRSLLRALDYLHSRPPHGILHADIKPGNIMLTSKGDIYLIDFNIALSLGEEGAVAVGRSFGYASPEHYRHVSRFHSNYNTENKTTEMLLQPGEETLTLPIYKTVSGLDSRGSSNPSQVILDVRSDIYSLGATLYHLLTGIKPAQKAEQVAPISSDQVSQPLIDIVAKAMHPDPEQRYQTAKEMLDAVLNIKKADIRYKRYRRRLLTASTFLCLAFAVSAFTFFVGLKQLEKQEQNLKLAEYSANELYKGDVDAAIDYALQAIQIEKSIFSPPNSAKAQLALTSALNVYDLSDSYTKYKSFSLPSKPISLLISPNKKRAMVLCSGQFVLFDLDKATSIATIPAVNSALSEMAFIDDDKVVLAAKDGLALYSISRQEVLWRGELATAITYAPEKQLVAALYKDDSKAKIYNLDGDTIAEIDFGTKKQSVIANDIFENPHDNLFEISPDGKYLAVSFADGSCQLYDLENGVENVVLLEAGSGFNHFEGAFQGKYFALAASQRGQSNFSVVDTSTMSLVGGFDSEVNFSLRVVEAKIILQNANILVEFNPETGEQIPLVTTEQIIEQYALNSEYTLITAQEFYYLYDRNAQVVLKAPKLYDDQMIALGRQYIVFASLNSPDVQILKRQNHREETLIDIEGDINYDEARLSQNGETVMFFSYDKFALYGMDGKLIKSQVVADAPEVYDQQYRKENPSYLEVVYNDGTRRHYSAANGELLATVKGDDVNGDLSETFETANYIINSSLHRSAVAIDKKTGKEVKRLSTEDFLTYISEVDNYIIAEYISTSGMRYGVLLDQNLEELAYLPNLTDVHKGQLIFKYQTGSLRQSPIYDLQQLIKIGQAQLAERNCSVEKIE